MQHFQVTKFGKFRRTDIDFDDLEVMEELLAKNSSKASITEIFGFMIPSRNEDFLDEWAELDEVEDFKAKGMKASGAFHDEKIGSKLLLLLGYIMLTNVLDDKSNETQPIAKLNVFVLLTIFVQPICIENFRKK